MTTTWSKAVSDVIRGSDCASEGAGADMMCVTTRFQLKHVWQLVPMYVMYLRLRRDLHTAPGLIRHAFLIQGPRACCTISIWESERALLKFANLPAHIDVLRRSQPMCRAIWSAYWRLDGISRSAHDWPGVAAWPELTPHPIFNRLIPPVKAEVAG